MLDDPGLPMNLEDRRLLGTSSSPSVEPNDPWLVCTLSICCTETTVLSFECVEEQGIIRVVFSID